MKKLIVRVQGGTGNQLFQYAFARGTAAKLGADYLIDRKASEDARWDPYTIHRHYSLDLFNTKTPVAGDSALFGFVWLRKHHRFFDKLYARIRGKSILFPFYYPEQTFAYDSGVLSRKKDTYYDGYWQTEKYFVHIADQIRTEITLVKPLSAESEAIRKQIRGTNAVSLHVRRGDYTTDPIIAAYHGVCSPEYYAAAIAYIEKNVKDPHLFVFSDDYAWASEHFKSIGLSVTCIKGSEAKDYEDLMLMRECNHHIIANSSFSWWGAWLNPKKDKIVIGPKVWFKNAPKADMSDIFPEGWIKM